MVAKSKAKVRSLPVLTVEVAPLLDDFWTGIPVFTRRLIQALLHSGKVDLRFCAGLTSVPADRVTAAIRYGTGAFLREEIERLGPDETNLPDPAATLLVPSVKRSFGVHRREASTVHDMSTLFMPENHTPENVAFHLDNMVHELATNETTFCVSEATQAALTLAFPSVNGRTRVLYQYVDWPPEFERMDRNLPGLRLGRYAAVIGTIEPRKNLTLLLRALSHPAVRDTDLRFVIIGRKGWLVDEFLAELPPEARSRLIFSGYVSEFVKYRLLKNAEFLVFPSIYEGFGIPAVEAMSLGKPVLAARTSSFPEVVGESGVYFDPLSVDEFAEALTSLDNPKRLTGMATAAMAASGTFTMQRMAAPVLDWLNG